MDLTREKKKKGLIGKTWDRCKSFGKSSSEVRSSRGLTIKSKSWPRLKACPAPSEEVEIQRNNNRKQRQVAPEGCFSVYVGPHRQRFVVRTECANHPLFKMLLEEAESEYGFHSEGPLWLPCKVDLFCKVLAEMDSEEGSGSGTTTPSGCIVSKGCGSYHLLTPSNKLVAMNQF